VRTYSPFRCRFLINLRPEDIESGDIAVTVFNQATKKLLGRVAVQLAPLKPSQQYVVVLWCFSRFLSSYLCIGVFSYVPRFNLYMSLIPGYSCRYAFDAQLNDAGSRILFSVLLANTPEQDKSLLLSSQSCRVELLLHGLVPSFPAQEVLMAACTVTDMDEYRRRVAVDPPQFNYAKTDARDPFRFASSMKPALKHFSLPVSALGVPPVWYVYLTALFHL